MLPPRQHTIDMTGGNFGPTCYGVARNAAGRSPDARLAFAGSAVHHSVVLLPLGVLV
jgi:hypothetical protein